jgi:hypothetical protein
VQLFHPTTILCDTISLYLNTYFSRNFLHYHPFRQGFEPFCICCTHKSKRNVKPTLSNALTIVGWDCVHLQYPHCCLYIRFPGKDVIACLTAFAGLHGITQARVCRLAVSSLESVCPPLDSRGKHSRHVKVPESIRKQIDEHIRSFPVMKWHTTRELNTTSDANISRHC